jgi:hypothetical protein
MSLLNPACETAGPCDEISWRTPLAHFIPAQNLFGLIGRSRSGLERMVTKYAYLGQCERSFLIEQPFIFSSMLQVCHIFWSGLLTLVPPCGLLAAGQCE